MKYGGDKPDLVLPGTHFTFTGPWIPPFGVPDCTLARLQRKLLQIVKRRFGKDISTSGPILYSPRSSDAVRPIEAIPQYIPSF